MMKIIASVVGIALYFILAWAIKDILWSAEYEWVLNMSVWTFELLMAAVAATIAAGIAGWISVDNIDAVPAWLMLGAVFFGIVAFIFTFIPVSMGAVVIFNIINIVGILIAALTEE